MTPIILPATSPAAADRHPGGEPSRDATPATRTAAPPAPSVPLDRAEALPRLLAALASEALAAAPDPVAAGATAIRALDSFTDAAVVPEAILTALRAALGPEASPDEPAGTAQVLRRAFEEGGALFEARAARVIAAAPHAARPPSADLRTLIGAVLSRLARPADAAGSTVNGAVDASHRAPAEDVRAALAAAGQAALSTQVRAAAHAEEHGVWRVEIPLTFGGRHVHLRCEIEPDREGHGARARGQRSGHLDVLVTPEGAAPLEARLAWRGDQTMAVDVFVDTEARASALASGRDALATALRSAGFRDARVEIWTNPARIARWATPQPPVPRAGRALDTRA